MGSGLIKCFITSQTIPEGIPVVVFPVIQQTGYEPVEAIYSWTEYSPYKEGETPTRTPRSEKKEIITPNGSVCYANCFYEFQGVKFHAKGDDYQKQELENTLENRISFLNFIKYLYQSSLVTIPGKNQYHDHGFDIKELLKDTIDLGAVNDKGVFQFHKNENNNQEKNLDWDKVQELYEQFLDIADEGRIVVMNGRRPVVLKFAVCLQSAYDQMIRLSKDQERTRYYNIDSATEEACTKLKPNMTEDEKRDVVMLFQMRLNHSSTDISCNGYTIQFYEQMRLLQQDLTEANLKAVKHRLSYLFDFISMQEVLNQINVPILPMTGYAQDYQNDNGKLFAKIVNEAQSAVETFIEKKYGDYDADEDEE